MSSNNSNETENSTPAEDPWARARENLEESRAAAEAKAADDPWARARKALEEKKAVEARAKAVVTGVPQTEEAKAAAEIAESQAEENKPGKKVNRQTVSYLSKRFEEVGLFPNRRHGQNFLVDLNLITMIANSAEPCKNDVILEVGTGMGSLTGMLAEKAAHVITVEIDGYLYQMASEELEAFDNIQMLKQDALKNKNLFDDTVIEAIKTALAAAPNRVFKLAANLPYNIATPVIANLLRSEVIPAMMSVTIQRELADRITAKPRSKDYGSLSVWVQSMADAEVVRIMPPHVFWPRPKVDSAILKITYRPEKAAKIPDIDFFYAFVRAMFFHRRKFMRSVAVAAFKGQLTKPQVDEVLAAADLQADARTEQLTVEELQALSELFRQKLIEVTGEEKPRLANQGK
jgi:16S rRNA (adenine1518-N6/adenine1519-N6)-dimethyltransferase